MKTLDGGVQKPRPAVQDYDERKEIEEVGPGGCLGDDCCKSCGQGRHCNNGHSCRVNERPSYNPFASRH